MGALLSEGLTSSAGTPSYFSLESCSRKDKPGAVAQALLIHAVTPNLPFCTMSLPGPDADALELPELSQINLS